MVEVIVAMLACSFQQIHPAVVLQKYIFLPCASQVFFSCFHPRSALTISP